MENSIKIQNKEIQLSRLRLKEWSGLESLKRELDTAVSKRDPNQIFNCMVKFIETAVLPSPSGIDWSIVPWYEFVEIYTKAIQINSPTIEFPILRGNGGDTKKQPWEYEGRSWYFWFNLFAQHYGWTENVIATLDVDDALGLYQELQLDDQLEKEWQWGLSEIAYPYNKGTKKQEYKPLQRPAWMMPLIPKQLPMVRMKKAHIPVGNIIDLSAPPEKKRKDGI